MESGTTFLEMQSQHSEADPGWQKFVNGIPGCEHAAPGKTFDCLRSVSDAVIHKSFKQQEGSDIFRGATWRPVIDGPGGVIPDKPTNVYKSTRGSKIAFIAGNNKDEGKWSASLRDLLRLTVSIRPQAQFSWTPRPARTRISET